jgi:PD-(D/E)XK endonuclease
VKTFELGGQTEAVVLSALSKAGYTVLVPFGVARYDLAIDDGSDESIKTVQCKTGRFRNGSVVWNAHSSHTLTHVRTSYRGQVDYFGVWCPDFEDVYLGSG